MKRDIPIAMVDKDNYVNFTINMTSNPRNIYEAFAQRYIKVLMSDNYGKLIKTVFQKKKIESVRQCVANTDDEIKRMAAQNPGSIYSIYDEYRIKKLDINRQTATLTLEIELMFAGGASITVNI